MLRSPLRWVGGKYRVRDQIIALFPPHTCYVEVFAGAAWVLFGKPAETSKSEVLNDLDGELINFWRVVKHRPAEFSEAASKVLGSRELFDEWKPMRGPGEELDRAVQFYTVIRLAFGAKRSSNHFGYERKASAASALASGPGRGCGDCCAAPAGLDRAVAVGALHRQL